MKTTIKCLLVSLLSSLVFTLASTQAHAQQRRSSSDSTANTAVGEDKINEVLANTLLTETKTVSYYIDSDGKRHTVSQGKTQAMWTEILAKCPSCIEIAKKNNIKIYQNKWYVKKER
jgi:hypothetical protein